MVKAQVRRAALQMVRWLQTAGPAALFALLFLCAAPAAAQTYRWTDAQGRVHLTDNPYNIPPEYAGQTQIYQEYGLSEESDIPLKKEPVGYVVVARLNGVTELRLLLDTGANTTVISPEAFRRGAPDAPLEREVLLVTAGGETRAATGRIASLAVGGTKMGPMTVVVHDAVPGYDGLLGMDYLGKYHFEIIATGPKLRLTPQ